eukprot:6532489-Alexandrium_andersonii.AAC.1
MQENIATLDALRAARRPPATTPRRGSCPKGGPEAWAAAAPTPAPAPSRAVPGSRSARCRPPRSALLESTSMSPAKPPGAKGRNGLARAATTAQECRPFANPAL